MIPTRRPRLISAPPVLRAAAALLALVMAPGRPLPAQEQADTAVQEGKKVFDDVCSACHTLTPPPNLAPPMQMVARHLRERFPTEAEGVAHIVSFVPAPDAARAVMPEHAIQRFGLMAPLPLPVEMLEKVARYVWSLGEGGHAMGAVRVPAPSPCPG